MDTVCRSCVFAEWEGVKQAGCNFDRIEKFEEQGAVVTLEDDHEKLYARIVGRICNTCRHPDTLSGIPARKWMETVRKEVIPRVAMAVYVDDDNSFATASKSLNSLLNQTIKPFEVILIYNVQGREAHRDYALWLMSSCRDVPWRIQTIKVADAAYGKSIDLTFESSDVKAVYFAVCRAGYEFPSDYIETIDKAINDELIRFVAIMPESEDNGFFIQRSLHNFIRGNKETQGFHSSVEKVRAIAEEEGTSHMVKTFEELKQMVR